MNRGIWAKAFPPLNNIVGEDAYAKALECHLLGYSEYLADLLYDKWGKLHGTPYVSVKLVEDLKIRIDQTIVECVARMKAQDIELQKTIDGYLEERDHT